MATGKEQAAVVRTYSSAGNYAGAYGIRSSGRAEASAAGRKRNVSFRSYTRE